MEQLLPGLIKATFLNRTNARRILADRRQWYWELFSV